VTTIQLYLSRAFLIRLGLLVVTFIVLFEMFDMLANADEVVDRTGSIAGLGRYALLRVPEIVSQSLPFAVLLAALLSLAALAQSNEIVVLKSAGVSFLRLLLILLPVAMGVGAVHFLIADQVVPRLAPALEEHRLEERAADGSDAVWIRDSAAVVELAQVTRNGRSAEGVTIWRRNDKGNVYEIVRARRAFFEDGAWTLEDATVDTLSAAVLHREETMPWPTRLRPSQLSAFAAHPVILSLQEIRRFIRRPEVGTRPAHFYATWLQERLSLPFRAVLMVLLAAPAAHITRRQGGLAAALAAGITVGFLYFVADGVALSLGEAGQLPPLVAAWVPGLIFAALGFAMVLEVER